MLNSMAQALKSETKVLLKSGALKLFFSQSVIQCAHRLVSFCVGVNNAVTYVFVFFYSRFFFSFIFDWRQGKERAERPYLLTAERPCLVIVERPCPLTTKHPCPLTAKCPSPLTAERPCPLT